ncbi:MAG: hypothetical protein WC488_05195 [Candidatus Micrarchaeia archaeon]
MDNIERDLKLIRMGYEAGAHGILPLADLEAAVRELYAGITGGQAVGAQNQGGVPPAANGGGF